MSFFSADNLRYAVVVGDAISTRKKVQKIDPGLDRVIALFDFKDLAENYIKLCLTHKKENSTFRVVDLEA